MRLSLSLVAVLCIPRLEVHGQYKIQHPIKIRVRLGGRCCNTSNAGDGVDGRAGGRAGAPGGRSVLAPSAFPAHLFLSLPSAL